MARTIIYTTTKFRIYKNAGGRFIPQHKSPYSNKWESFKELGTTVTRDRRSNAEKFILKKSKVDLDPKDILFIDSTLPSEEEQHIQQLKDLLAKKLNKSYWVSLSIDELTAFHRDINAVYNWLRTNDVSESHIEQIEIEAGLY